MVNINTKVVWWIGLDVHADEIQVAVYRGWETAPREEFAIANDKPGLGRLLKKLGSLEGEVRCAYEAGPCGYTLYRWLRKYGIACDIAAPTLIRRSSADKVKTDRRDARKLAQEHRSVNLTVIRIPSEREETVRDLVRAREDLVQDVRRRRHRLGKFLLRHGYRYRDGKAWTGKHTTWLGHISFEGDESAQTVFDEYRAGLEQTQEQLLRLTSAIGKVASLPEYKASVDRLQALRGVKTVTAMTIVAEMGDLRRFAGASEFMAATGLVPSEHSSGGRRRQGSITKTGNAHVSRVLVEASWHYRHRPVVSAELRERRKNQARGVVAIAERADQRLYRKFRKMIERAKPSTVAVVGVARELAGFIWAIGQQTA
jgi:transposase